MVNYLARLLTVTVFLSCSLEVSPLKHFPWTRPDFLHAEELRTTASHPWPHNDNSDDGNLCAKPGVVGMPARQSPHIPPYLKVTLVMGADAKFGAAVARCMRHGWDTPLVANTAYADKWGYALRYYVDEEIPLIVQFGKNAMQGELRKVFALADVLRPEGPRYGKWMSVVQWRKGADLIDAAMWVDGDAHIAGLDPRPGPGLPPAPLPRRRWEFKASSSLPKANATALGAKFTTSAEPALADSGRVAAAVAGTAARENTSTSSLDWAWDGAIPVEEVVRRSCPRAEHPPGFVRVLAQDSGPSVNAGWYLLSRCRFTTRLLHYWLELFRIYQPCKMWGQHLIQEALLVVMGGKSPDHWSLSLPCTGRAFHALPRATEIEFEKECLNNTSYTSSDSAVKSDQQWEALLDYAFHHEFESNTAQTSGPALSFESLRHCVLRMSTQSVAHVCSGKLKYNDSAGRAGGISLQEEVGSLNSCFARSKYDWTPNAEANWLRAEGALAADQQGHQSTDIRDNMRDITLEKLTAEKQGRSTPLGSDSGGDATSSITCRTSGHVHCCDGHNHFAHPVCNRGAFSSNHESSKHLKEGDNVKKSSGIGVSEACVGNNTTTKQSRAFEAGCGPPLSEQWWSAAGAGVVLLAEGDGWVRFNALKFKTHLLWHHGHGRLLEPGCT